jgi:plastocyanin
MICSEQILFILFFLFLFVFGNSVMAQVIQPITFVINIVPGASNPNTNIPFFPSPVNLPLGSTVKWINNDTSLHTVTSFNNAFDSPILSTNQQFNHTFFNVGYYSYYCRLHPFMNGVIAIS